jgi:hypothetical protein
MMRGRLAGAVAVMMVLGSASFAQTVLSDRDKEAPKTTGNQVVMGDGRVDNGDDVKSKLKEDEFVDVGFDKYADDATAKVSEMRAMLDRGLTMLKAARDRKDAVEITCVNEEVTSMKGILRVAEDALVSLQEDIATDAKGRARADYRKVVTLKRRMTRILERAQQCAGVDSTVSSTDTQFNDGGYDRFDPYYGDDSMFFDARDGVQPGRSGRGRRDVVRDFPSSDFYLF